VSQKLTAGIPESPDITGGWRVVFAALDPTTGAAVTGVTVSHAVLLVETDASAEELAAGPFMLVPGPEA
jgi:hypothetical protein